MPSFHFNTNKFCSIVGSILEGSFHGSKLPAGTYNIYLALLQKLSPQLKRNHQSAVHVQNYK